MTTEVPDADDLPAAPAEQALEQARRRNSQLAGADQVLEFVAKHDLVEALVILTTCKKHGGAHHFAVTGEGLDLWASESALECIKDGFATFEAMGETAPEQDEQDGRPKPYPRPEPVSSPRERCPDCGGVEIAPYRFDHERGCPNGV